MRKFIILLISALFLSGCSSFKYETKEEYALKMVEAMNNQDLKDLDKLFSSEAIIYYDATGQKVALGKASDQKSELYRLVAMNTKFEDVEVVAGLNGAVVFTAMHTDDLSRIYGYQKSEYSAYDVVVDKNKIVCIYAYYNEEEALENKAHQEAQIGIEVKREDDHLEITNVIQGTVSSVMQLQASDYIYKIDDVDVANMSLAYNEAELYLMGEVGSECKLEIKRMNKENHETIYLTRQPLTDYTDTYDILEDNGIGFEYGEYFGYYEGE